MKTDAYQVITDRIVGLLERGMVPWQKPWQGGEMVPRNLISRKEYRGVNVFLLHAMMYESPFWLTFNQAKELGGHVKKGLKKQPARHQPLRVPGCGDGSARKKRFLARSMRGCIPSF